MKKMFLNDRVWIASTTGFPNKQLKFIMAANKGDHKSF